MALDIQEPALPDPLAAMPRSTELRLPIEPFRISLLSGLRLDRCRLGQLVAEQNSTLGQIRSPSARLRYELDSIVAIEQCLQSPVADSQHTATLLHDALEHKLATLPLYIDQTLTRSDEVRTVLRPAPRHLNDPLQAELINYEQTLEALHYLVTTFQLAEQQRFTEINLQPFNGHFRTLAQNDFLPRLLRTMHHTSAWIHQATTAMEALSNDTCRRVTGAYNMYSNSIYPLLITQLGYQQQLQPLLTDLTEFSTQQAWTDYLGAIRNIGSQFSAQANAHIKNWHHVAESCQLSALGS